MDCLHVQAVLVGDKPICPL